MQNPAGDVPRVAYSVIIPTYNEERRIEATIRTIHSYLEEMQVPFELIISDDGSVDGTALVVRRCTDDGVPVRFLPAREHKGKGSTTRRGVLASRGDHVLITDADLSTPIAELPRLMERLRLGADIAIGSRALRASRLVVRQPFYREWSGRIFNILVRALLHLDIRDTQCGFKLMRGPVARGLFALSTVNGFACDVEVLALAVKAGLRVEEVPVSWSHCSDSRVRIGRDATAMLFELARIAISVRTREAPRIPSRVAADACESLSLL